MTFCSAAPSLLAQTALAIFVVIAPAGLSTAAAQSTVSPEQAKQDPDFQLQGEYLRSEDGAAAQVVALGEGEFRVVLFQGGLPGAGATGQPQELLADAEEISDLLDGYARVVRTSPTLGLPSPSSAIVLFDGTQQTFQSQWQPGARMSDDGLLMQGATSKPTFSDYTLHLEFRTPFEPQDRGQARGNSGVYQQGRYEVQILDSFGLNGRDNEAGGLYGVRAPDVNMCLPPLSWQTYDIDFVAARFENGTKVSPARITVRLNGRVVQNDVPLPELSGGAPVAEGPRPGPLFLQDHGDEVRFRNIWVKPQDFSTLARRPIVPAFERFHSATNDLTAAAGVLLLGELNCVACHQPNEALAETVAARTAPSLDQVGQRVQPEWLIRFVANPHDVKPGTTMPDMLSGLDESQRRSAALALASFLIADQQITAGSQPADPRRGQQVFHQVGCVACHQTRETDQLLNTATSVPLPDLAAKYSFASLEQFLKNPLAVRPSGRMPHFDLADNDRRSLVQYLLGDSGQIWSNDTHPERPKHANLKYKLYYGNWDNLPDFASLEPDETGEVAGFDFRVSDKRDGFAVSFEGFVPVPRTGEYTFRTVSDDGSALYIDGERIVLNDGVHPAIAREGKVRLKAGVHQIRVDYFEKGGQEELRVFWAGPEVSGPSGEGVYLDSAVALTPDDLAPVKADPEDRGEHPSGDARSPEEYRYQFDPELVATGRKLFTSLGCANCHHRSENGQRILSDLAAPALAECKTDSGCLNQNPKAPTARIPNYDLSERQLLAIGQALTNAPPAATPAEVLHASLKRFNCIACHQRDDLGGPEADRNRLFTSTIPEMGDEGRLPPLLTGVGDKLNENYLKHLFANGADERPYMHTMMPRFGDATARLPAVFVALDQRTEAPRPQLEEPPNRLAAIGRNLAGDKGFSCVKCHTFGKYKATGIQAIALERMATRLRRDWFQRYLVDPNRYRPGTRMPTAFPNGKSIIPDLFGGDPHRQLTAMWAYLEKGIDGGVPDGVAGGLIEVKPTDRPVIYRNFIEGLSERGIAVGYPEEANLAWDADRLNLTLIWHGKFIDGSLHWTGRGQGRQRPLGHNVRQLENVVPIAVLQSEDQPWPGHDVRARGYQFSGYQLDPQGRPTFRYRTRDFSVEDRPIPIIIDDYPALRRTISISADGDSSLSPQPEGKLMFRAVQADQVRQVDERTFQIGESMQIRIESAARPVVRTSNGQTEVLVPMAAGQTVEQLIQW